MTPTLDPRGLDPRQCVPVFPLGLIQRVWLVDLGCSCQAKVFPDSGTMFPVRQCARHATPSMLCRSCRMETVRAGARCGLCDQEAR